MYKLPKTIMFVYRSS